MRCSNPAFIARAAGRHFHRNDGRFDGSGEVSLIDLQGPAERVRNNRPVRRIVKQAGSADQRTMSMN